ncbi:formate dehydrogenase accessory sulfurtransferase FdhD [Streptomyces sp. BI20]|uniref:formate dehydrogenase accessory sulfurtransferase FdhD n=1 Tax=Streptomyces sp. BI20 TaxID=3403460 RepID=UPI003C7291C1
MGRVTERRRVTRVRGGRPVGARSDTLAVEEPLEIRLDGRSLAVTMRSPGDDFALAVGFLVSEGIVGSAADVGAVTYCEGRDEDGANTYNVVNVRLAPGVPVPAGALERAERFGVVSSSCGLCGKTSLAAVRTATRFPGLPGADPVRVSPEVLAGLPDRLRAVQKVFSATGGAHAAALCSAEGELLEVAEDVGRHNAVDKVIGRAARAGLLPLRGRVLLVSSRASFELAQKAVMAGIPVLAAVSAPSSLAVDLAAESGLTLIGFLRGEDMNVYAGEERLLWSPEDSPAGVGARGAAG